MWNVNINNNLVETKYNFCEQVNCTCSLIIWQLHLTSKSIDRQNPFIFVHSRKNILSPSLLHALVMISFTNVVWSM